jgi:hypothetical protein
LSVNKALLYLQAYISTLPFANKNFVFITKGNISKGKTFLLAKGS